MKYKIELESDCVEAVLRTDLQRMLKTMQEDLRKRKLGVLTAGIFEDDLAEDVKELNRHIAAFKLVLKYYGG
jgi:hypothetical protein